MYKRQDIDTLERLEIIRDLRMDVFDVLIGINLLREGLDIPEVALVAILDADKEGFLRSETSLIQTIGRAARNSEGRVIMYADVMTDSMNKAITETYRRREIQIRYNEEHGIVPQTIKKKVYDIIQLSLIHIFLKEDIADVILVGNRDKVLEAGKGCDLSKAIIIDPENYERMDEVVAAFCEARKSKGLTPEEALQTAKADYTYFGAVSYTHLDVYKRQDRYVCRKHRL